MGRIPEVSRQAPLVGERLERLVLNDQMKALRGGGSYLHDEVFERGPIRGKVGAEILEEELVDGLSTLEGDPFGLGAGYLG